MKQWIAAYTLALLLSVQVMCGILGKIDRGKLKLNR